MNIKQKRILVSFITSITFLAMVTVNALATILPINGINTGQVSDLYPNLFTPAGITFAIWGIIYLLLALFTLYLVGIFHGKGIIKKKLLIRTGIIFSISSLANIAWIFSWHYQIIPLSMVLMVAILVCLIMVMQEIDKEILTKREMFFIKIPFSVYFGWITVATIANATVLLVSLNWDGFGISPTIWTIVVILIGTIIGITRVIRVKDIAYGLVFIWAYAGILIKHISTDLSRLDEIHLEIITTLIFCIAIFLIVEAYAIFSKDEKDIFET
jgi:hypothetical protein